MPSKILRKGIDYIGVGTGAMIFNNIGQVFLAQRGIKARNEKGLWDFPGGSVEFGEKCEDATIREIKEEYGFEIEIMEFLEFVNHIMPTEKQHWVSTTFIAKYKSGQPKILEPEKCSQIKWINLKEINPRTLTIASQSDLKTYIKKFGFKIPSQIKIDYYASNQIRPIPTL
ncbi:MAG: NUDIX domain-containing protein [Patescibacteria group bacterium]|jgi:mutator protein MutT